MKRKVKQLTFFYFKNIKRQNKIRKKTYNLRYRNI